MPEGQQPFRVATQPDFAREQRPQQILFLCQETEPGFTVGDDMNIAGAVETFFDFDGPGTNNDCRLSCFSAGESKMVGGV